MKLMLLIVNTLIFSVFMMQIRNTDTKFLYLFFNNDKLILVFMDEIKKYFPHLSALQLEQLERLKPLYEKWNAQINVISRKDMEEFYVHHVLHSLSIAKLINFKLNTKILDLGTGGGFPGIPLAILFENCTFHLVDAIGKKIKVVDDVVNDLELKNVQSFHARAENLKDKYDFIVSRAVTKMPAFITWCKNKISKTHKNGLPNGILYLKGGNLSEEMRPVQTFYKIYEIADYFDEDFFETKKIVYVQLY